MTTEEIRQKAIECGKANLEFCSEHHCDGCRLIDVNPCNQVMAYEHGFADGVRDFAEWVLRSPKIWQEDYMLLADVETLIHDYEQQMKGE